MARMNRPAPVEITYKNMRFLITHNPTNATLNKFIEVSQIVIKCLHITECILLEAHIGEARNRWLHIEKYFGNNHSLKSFLEMFQPMKAMTTESF